MEAFSLLKYWRGGAANSSSAAAVISDDTDFFDLELSVPVETDSPTGSDQNELKLEPVSPLEELSEPVHNGFSRLKSATNFRVLLLKLKKNGEKTAKQKTGKSSGSSNNNSNKFLTIKLKIEEIPIRSVFKRDNSSKTRTNERRVFSKDVNVMQRYLKMVSKRYGGERKGEVEEGGKRRDDSLVQQQDGIQSAILHCKRSFNSSRDAEMSVLSRSVSDPSHDHHKSMNMAKKCSEELKEIGF